MFLSARLFKWRGTQTGTAQLEKVCRTFKGFGDSNSTKVSRMIVLLLGREGFFFSSNFAVDHSGLCSGRTAEPATPSAGLPLHSKCCKMGKIHSSAFMTKISNVFFPLFTDILRAQAHPNYLLFGKAHMDFLRYQQQRIKTSKQSIFIFPPISYTIIFIFPFGTWTVSPDIDMLEEFAYLRTPEGGKIHLELLPNQGMLIK